MKIKLNIKFKCPTVPNYITVGSKITVHISEFSEEELRQIGKIWTDELVKKAKLKEEK